MASPVVDPFELIKNKKPFPQIPGAPQNYAKEHREWIKKLVEDCISLRSEVDSLKSRLVICESKIDEFEKERETREATMDGLVKRIEQLETSSATQSTEFIKVVEETAKQVTLAEVVKRGTEYKNNDFEVNLALANIKEKREKEKRAKNIIIFGLNRVEGKKDDDEQAYELIDTLKVPRVQVERVTRLISKSPNTLSTRPPPFLIEFKTSSDRDSALKSTRNLKGIEKYNVVKVAHDLTPNERAGLKREQAICDDLNKDLPGDSPFVWRVRGGERMKIDKNTKRIYKPSNATGSSV